ncbi:AAA family ATPase [Veillonella sp.]|jgi:hypothetical protein|uniref:AAA family ATPase n=1 Tax=Veillonella sp. TaxID=1926307 RepID=UPI002912C987|nr:AAA family ATPase [Veillonella sp.]MDU6207470.1 AAA family ATPase [Veillonella sp.]
MNAPFIRLEDISIKNIKNVEYGHIKFNVDKKRSLASLLGLYGQNGSGKTVLINAIDILKQLLMGQRLPDYLVDYININSDMAELSFEFSMQFGDDNIHVYYDVEIARFKAISDNNADNLESIKTIPIVKKEVLQYRVENGVTSIRKNIIANTDTTEVFVPKSKFEILFGKHYDDMTDFLVDKRLCQATSRSFLFSSLFLKRLNSRREFLENSTEYNYIFKIIHMLVRYGNNDLFVVLTSHSGLHSLNILPLEINVQQDNMGRIGTITLPLDEPITLPIPVVDEIHNIISMMNLVLSEIIPGLQISASDLGIELLENGESGKRLMLVSNKNNKSIPLKYESEGIRKIISILSLLIAVYNRPSVTIAVDELDAGIFEYLLGELLRIIAEKGKGQLIFTSHNLRPLETLDKGYIAFTTTNPNNRYIRPKNVKISNNLRDFYYRDITLGEQAEEVYKPTQNAEISYAFKKAGVYKWHEKK